MALLVNRIRLFYINICLFHVFNDTIPHPTPKKYPNIHCKPLNVIQFMLHFGFTSAVINYLRSFQACPVLLFSKHHFPILLLVMLIISSQVYYLTSIYIKSYFIFSHPSHSKFALSTFHSERDCYTKLACFGDTMQRIMLSAKLIVFLKKINCFYIFCFPFKKILTHKFLFISVWFEHLHTGI